MKRETQRQLFGGVLWKSCPAKFTGNICARKKVTLAQVFSCKFCEIFKNTYFYRTLPMPASGGSKLNVLISGQNKSCLSIEVLKTKFHKIFQMETISNSRYNATIEPFFRIHVGSCFYMIHNRKLKTCRIAFLKK